MDARKFLQKSRKATAVISSKFIGITFAQCCIILFFGDVIMKYEGGRDFQFTVLPLTVSWSTSFNN